MRIPDFKRAAEFSPEIKIGMINRLKEGPLTGEDTNAHKTTERMLQIASLVVDFYLKSHDPNVQQVMKKHMAEIVGKFFKDEEAEKNALVALQESAKGGRYVVNREKLHPFLTKPGNETIPKPQYQFSSGKCIDWQIMDQLKDHGLIYQHTQAHSENIPTVFGKAVLKFLQEKHEVKPHDGQLVLSLSA